MTQVFDQLSAVICKPVDLIQSGTACMRLESRIVLCCFLCRVVTTAHMTHVPRYAVPLTLTRTPRSALSVGAAGGAPPFVWPFAAPPGVVPPPGGAVPPPPAAGAAPGQPQPGEHWAERRIERVVLGGESGEVGVVAKSRRAWCSQLCRWSEYDSSSLHTSH